MCLATNAQYFFCLIILLLRIIIDFIDQFAIVFVFDRNRIGAINGQRKEETN